MTTVLTVLGIALLLALLAFADSNRRSKKIERAFAGRRPLGDEEFFHEYFVSIGVAKEVPVKVRRILSQELDADLSRIAPDDDFTTNLKFLLDFDSLADVAIVQSLEKEFGVIITDEEATAMHTVKDMVLGVTMKLRAPQ
jgi:acyl carrier protein